MGQLTRALEATKELRKQFKPQKKQKKPSKRDQKIIDAIENSDFGCQKENVYQFAEALLERKISRAPQTGPSSPRFLEVSGAAVAHVSDDVHNGVVVIDEGYDGIRWLHPLVGTSHEHGRYFNSWRPATDKEIREYFS